MLFLHVRNLKLKQDVKSFLTFLTLQNITVAPLETEKERSQASEAVQFGEHLPACTKPWDPFLTLQKLGKMGALYYPHVYNQEFKPSSVT